jgi:UDP-N-acetylmuramoyl-L-alanyl-D-glutamate--2,6-diaminopimelate ligase
MKLIGSTGTNGKTITSYIIDEIFAEFGFKKGLFVINLLITSYQFFHWSFSIYFNF